MKVITLITINEFCEIAKVSRPTVYKLFREDAITAYRAPNKKRKLINPAEVLRVVTQNPEALGKCKLGSTKEQRLMREAKKYED